MYPGLTTDHKINTFNIYNKLFENHLIYDTYFFKLSSVVANEFEIFTIIIQFLGVIHYYTYKDIKINFTKHLNLLMLKLVAILPYLNLITMRIFQGIFMYIFDEVNLLLNYQNLIKFF